MRLDKFLKVSRVIKRRTVANEAADSGREKVIRKEEEVCQILCIYIYIVNLVY